MSAKEIMDRFHIPRGSFYRMLHEGSIPYIDKTEPWHKRPQYRFDPDAVAAKLAERRALGFAPSDTAG